MKIRLEQTGDPAQIRAVTTAAFAETEHASGTEAQIIEGLRQSGDLQLSLVAEDDGAILGHVAFSPVKIAGEECGWVGLGPVSVQPDHQGRGIGRALIDAGLKRLREAGAAGCVVLGDPRYYGRFGFACSPGLRFTGAPPEYFMALGFAGDLPSGEVSYAAPFYAQ
jgi:putative acetyltransferase